MILVGNTIIPAGSGQFARLRQAIGISLVVLAVAGCHSTSEYAPHSSPVEVGVPVEWIVYSGCGLSFTYFDLDGSLWLPETIGPEDQTGTPAGFEADNDTGTLTLVSKEAANYRSSGGRVIALKRMPGNVVLSDEHC